MHDPGRPSPYRAPLAEAAHNYCLLGATDQQLAGFFQVSPETLAGWLQDQPEFARAVRDGRAAADAAVARRLYQRAMGYDRTATRTLVDGGQAISVEHTVHVPPDVGACIFWLRNRRRRDWLEGGRRERGGDPCPLPAADESPARAEGDTP
jgi:hypothetical protein